ncbi:MAG: hypothetical protein ABW061_07575 [Polyangiaceae bacterium]
MSAASQLNDSASDEAEAIGPASESNRPTEPHAWSVPPPPMYQALSALDLEEFEALDEDEPAGFDFHDTIPAPTWLDDAAESELPSLPPLAPLTTR